jgi:predicted CXXCH cytochrome family protein
MIMKAGATTLLVTSIIAVTAFALRPSFEGIRRGRLDAGYVASTKCIACHPDHYRSWARTYHGRMTQEARPDSVQGDFDNYNTLNYQGISARMERNDGSFFMTFTFPDGRIETNRIVRTVGSRRIQQYITEKNGQYTRQPVAYDLTNRRWMSLNGSFFYPDGKDYFGLRSAWDPNCVFCHNVKAQPNLDFKTGLFDTEVAELGIACGACHGPAAAHADAAASPLTRTLWRLSLGQPRQIVNPGKLGAERSLMVCGHCHGQRIPEPEERIREILAGGDPYNAGDDLAAYYRPVWRGSQVGPYSFANRFWRNGSPRLTAYEYQGLLRSKCFIDGDRTNRITCISCHSMHDGDPKGQITDENRSNKACLSCHQQYEGSANLARHTGHAADSAGSHCYDCHMPRVVYGIMSFHPTHDITVPDPQLTYSEQVPNACNQCHLDRSVNWAVAESKRLWPSRFSAASRSTDSEFDLPEGPRSLVVGDALTRALAAEALSGGGPARPDSAWARPWLIEALRDDYPIVRFFAAGGLSSGQRGEEPDYLNAAECASAIDQLAGSLDVSLRQRTAMLARMLRAKRLNADIEVGE